jgi:aryl-alcohol dehydrogenase-like predicted oxidoreductase
MQSDRIGRRALLGRGAAALGAAGLAARVAMSADAPTRPPADKILNHNSNMEYRRLGRTDFWVSAISLGGHWKRMETVIPGVSWTKGPSWMKAAPARLEVFYKNRYDVVSRCIESGVNLIDACAGDEILVYARALKGRRDKMFFSVSWYEREPRSKEWRTAAKLLQGFEAGLTESGIGHADLWRISLETQSSRHTRAEIEEVLSALDTAKRQGKARFTGISSHDRPHIKWMIETYPKQLDVVLLPYTAKSKELPQDSVFEAVRKHDVGVLGIKPFASGSLFKSGGDHGGPEAEEDSRRARLAIRYILGNPAISTSVPGLLTPRQVDNAAQAVTEWRTLDRSEQSHLRQAMDEAWTRLPIEYRWLREWESL